MSTWSAATSRCDLRSCCQRHIGENFVLLRFRLGLVFLVEILDRAFAQISERQHHDADKARRPVGGLGEHAVRAGLVPGAAGTIRMRMAAGVDADTAFEQTPDARSLMPVQISAAAGRE